MRCLFPGMLSTLFLSSSNKWGSQLAARPRQPRQRANNQEESWFPTQLKVVGRSLTPTWLPTESEAPSINPRSRVFSSCFLGASRFPRRRASLFLAILLSWRFAFPDGSRFLAIPVSWRFPTRLAGRGLVVLQLQLKVWLLLVPPRRLVFCWILVFFFSSNVVRAVDVVTWRAWRCTFKLTLFYRGTDDQ